MEVKTLYGLDKGGKFKVWNISTWNSDKGAVITITHGKEGGKLTRKDDVITEGKNIGRANETTPAEQAELEAMSRWRKQVDKGYRETKEELTELPLLPMLAHDYLKQGHRIKYPCFGSPKLDGVRCLAIRHEDRVELKSRGGKEYVVPHIQAQLMDCMTAGQVLDGELYIHGKYLEEIVSAVKKPNPDSLSLNYIIFDVVTEETYERRLIAMQAFRGYVLAVRECPNVEVINFCELQNEEHMKKMHKLFVANGYEGIMLRNHDGVYESGKRSADLQKYKEFFEEEFEITGVREDRNGNAVLELWDHVAKAHFECCYGDFEERAKQLREPWLYIKQALTVKFQTRYKDSLLPQFPTGVRVREGVWFEGIFVPSE